MGQIILVRHGQANSHATTEADYDRLSDLGKTQAGWLGDWMRAHAYEFDHVLSGTLQRHRQTVQAMGWEAEEDARLNEIDYYQLSESLKDVKGEPLPSIGTFASHMPKVFDAWSRAEIEGTETYDGFEARTKTLLEEASVPGRHVLCITSGGVIGMMLRHILDVDISKLAHLMLPIWNSSFHRLHVRDGATYLAGYNAIPHLELPEREYARTHV